MSSEKEELLRAFDFLAPQRGLASPLCRLISQGGLDMPTHLDEMCILLGVSRSRSGVLEKILDICLKLGIANKLSPLTWITTNKYLASELFPLLEGAKLYLNRVHKDTNLVEVVLTRPPSPSKMSNELESMLSRSWKIRDTRTLLPSIAELATKNFTVMTPFFDETGASIVLNLFRQTNAPNKYLILRATTEGRAPSGLYVVEEELNKLNVEILNFRLQKDDTSTETFHAKVVLADNEFAYVASSNMNKWSFEYSLELGFFVQGAAAGRIADILLSVRNVSHLFEK